METHSDDDRQPVVDRSKLAGIVLAKGAHDNPDDGLCLMEAIAFVQGIPHTDSPPCVSPVLAQFGRDLNDVLPDDTRQQLVPLIAVLPGTAGDGLDEQRGYMALDWLIRTWLPAWLDLVPSCAEDAAAIRALGQIVDVVSAEQAGPVVREAQGKAAAVAAAAWSAAWAATRAAEDAARAAAAGDAAAVAAAVGDAAWAATRAAEDAAGDAAWAAWDAARAAVGDAARAAAGDAARAAWAAAGTAAWDAAWDATRAAEDAARAAAARDVAGTAAGDAAGAAAVGDAAGTVLAPTVAQLQASAVELYTRMIMVGRDAA